jgi:hypothetical protein
MSVADINTAASAGVAAIRAGDWATAETELLAAATLLAVLPDSEFGSGVSALSYDRQAIDRLLGQVRKNRNAAAASAAGGLRQSKIVYQNTPPVDDC